MKDLASPARPVTPSRGNSTTRRQFLARIRGGAGAALASTAVSFRTSAKADEGRDNDDPGSVGRERVLDSYKVREQATRAEAKVPIPRQITNGDEQRYQNQNYIGNYSKGLSHNSLGEVDPVAYRSLLNGLRQGTYTALEDNIMLGADPGTKLVNPLAALHSTSRALIRTN